jgi:hypothetical protein
MEFGICLQSVAALRAEPTHKSEMVSQLLFGELFRIIANENNWLFIRLAYDNYEGWIDQRQSFPLEEEEFIRLIHADTPASLDLVQLLSNEKQQTVIPVLLGSSLPGIESQKFTICGDIFAYEGMITDAGTLPATSTLEQQKARQAIIDDAMLYLHAPYLWGGRTPFGIDCSGFTQMVFKLKNIRLLRDASQQATHGETINLITEAEPGDLAFFDDEEGKIVHVGLMIDKSQIIHASGKVRIDNIDHEGIFNPEENRYTHKLRLIKRIV